MTTTRSGAVWLLVGWADAIWIAVAAAAAATTIEINASFIWSPWVTRRRSAWSTSGTVTKSVASPGRARGFPGGQSARGRGATEPEPPLLRHLFGRRLVLVENPHLDVARRLVGEILL